MAKLIMDNLTKEKFMVTENPSWPTEAPTTATLWTTKWKAKADIFGQMVQSSKGSTSIIKSRVKVSIYGLTEDSMKGTF